LIQLSNKLEDKEKFEEGQKIFTKTDRGNRNTKIIDKYTKNIDRRTDGQTEASETIDK
jgi:hypothetical protein